MKHGLNTDSSWLRLAYAKAQELRAGFAEAVWSLGMSRMDDRTVAQLEAKAQNLERLIYQAMQPGPSLGWRFQGLQDRVDEFQRHRFTGQSVDAKFCHLLREVNELRANPADLSEWADCLILLLGAAAASGIDCNMLLHAADDKMTVNEGRQWSGPDADGVY